MYALDCALWVPALIPYPANSREASNRHFPAGVVGSSEEGAAYPPIEQPHAAPEGTAVLEFTVEDERHLAWSLDRSMTFLQGNNSLNDSIGEQGVMVPLIVAVSRISHPDATDDLTVLTTPDGSSRTASALTLLDLEPTDVVHRLGDDDRRYRQYISDILSALDRSSDEVSQEEIEQVRALQVPARLLLEFSPDDENVNFAVAVDSLVHLVHVEPPKQWDEAAAYDAKAEVVLDEMVNFEVISEARRHYLAGMLIPENAARRRFPEHEDERAATLLRVFRAEKSHEAVKQGIRVLSPNKYARREEKVNIAVELALRAERASMNSQQAKIARTTLRSAFLERELWAGKWSVTRDDPDLILREARKEIKQDGPGSRSRELAVLGVYWLAIHGLLREAHFFAEKEKRDGRNPQRIIAELLRRPWGLFVFHQAVVDGRDNMVPRRVDDKGRLLKNAAGESIEMSNQWLRGQVVPEDVPIDVDDQELTAIARLRNRTAFFASKVASLEDAHNEIRGITGPNDQVLIDEEGWDSSQTAQLKGDLDTLGSKLVIYGHLWDMRQGEDDG